MEKMLLYALIAHLICCALYYLAGSIWLTRQERVGRLLICLFIPVFGFFALLVSDLFKGRPKEITDSIDMLSSKGEFKYIEPVDRERQQNTVPLEEVLLVNDYKTKRKMLLDVFKESPEKYIKELKIALEDPDTETSHYASAALMEINRNYLNSIAALAAEMRVRPEEKGVARDYAELLLAYIDSDVMDRSNRNKYERQFMAVAEGLLTDRDRAVKPAVYKALVLLTDRFGDSERAEVLSEQFIDLFPEHELSYLTQMQFYYEHGRAKDFKVRMQTLMSSSVVLTKKGLSTLRFFLR